MLQDLELFLESFLKWCGGLVLDWVVCVFGYFEIECFVVVIGKGGKVCIGFENSFWNWDGFVVKDNVDWVRDLVLVLREKGFWW